MSRELEKLMEERKTLLNHEGDRNYIPVTANDTEHHTSQVIATIITHGDAVGSVIIMSGDRKMQEAEKQMAMTAAGFLGSQMEQ